MNASNRSSNPSDLKPANTQLVYLVSRSDLPLSCPTPDMALWNSHPRVYLAIEKTGKVLCPYCSAEFRLDDMVSSEEPASA